MDFSRLSLIIKREYLSIVAKKSFLLVTVLTPFILVLIGLIPVLLSQFNESDEARKVAVIDETGKYGSALKSDDEYKMVLLDSSKASKAREYYDKAQGEMYAIVIIPRDVLETKRADVFSDKAVNMSLISRVESDLDSVLSEAKLASYQVPELKNIIEDCNVKVDVKSIKWGEDGEESFSPAEISMTIGMVLALVIYMFVLMYGAMIMNNVIEEKTNRIVEVIVSSCKPFELMMGKIIGVALVGLTQIAIWAVLMGTIGAIVGAAVIAPQVDMAAMTANGAAVTSSGELGEVLQSLAAIDFGSILVMFILYFIGGFLLYASLFAGFGSAVDQASDASQFTTPIMLVIIVALYAGIACMENPDGQMAVWCSIIPFTSPIVMMVRLPYDVPFWQMAVSLLALYGTAVACIYLSARIYRTGILLYGKKRSFMEVLKWIKGN